MSYLGFIFENQHLISEILEFWKSLNLNRIPISEVNKKENLKRIRILESLIRINPFLINSLDLKKNKENLEKNLYLFFNPYEDLKSSKRLQYI